MKREIEELKPREKITFGRIKLDIKYPFYSHLAYQLKVKEDESLPTMSVNTNGVMNYNPEFLENTDKKYMLFLLSHEILHVALRHLSYMKEVLNDIKNEDGDLMYHRNLLNYAADYVVNGILDDEGFNIKDFKENNFELIYNEKFKNKSIETVYHELLEEEDESLLPPKGISLEELLENFEPCDCDGDCDCPSVVVPYDILDYDNDEENDNLPKGEDIEDIWKQKIHEAYKYMKDRGDESGFVKEMIENLHKERINWRVYLRKEIRSLCKNKYNTVKPSRRGMIYGYNLPSIEGKSINIAVALDTSGSMTEKQLSDALSEIKGMLNMDNDVNIEFIMHDTTVKEQHTLNNHSNRSLLRENKFEVVGRGGTSHIPVFEWADDYLRSKNLDTLICFTDGYTRFPDRKPRYRTIWVLNSNVEPPFGDTIYMDE